MYLHELMGNLQSDFTAHEKQCSHVLICMLCHMHTFTHLVVLTGKSALPDMHNA